MPITPATSRAAREFSEDYVAADPVLLHAMSWAVEMGVGSVTPGAGAVLRLLAAAARARSVAEIGTGTGVSGLWLLRGMSPEGVLTSIDIEPDLQAMARQSFAAAGYPAGRVRLIPGTAHDVLPRLADGAYDLVFVDGDPSGYGAGVDAAHRLLREGGILVVNNALTDVGRAPSGRSAPFASAPAPVSGGSAPFASAPGSGGSVADVVARVREAPEWLPALIGAGEGLLCAAKRPAPPPPDTLDHGANVIQLRRS